MMTAVAVVRRQSLDALVAQMGEPGFVLRFRRRPAPISGSGHVEPAMLALSSPRSRYVRRWRRHAARCAACASVFRYYGLKV